MQRTASDSDSVEEFETASETDSSDDAVRDIPNPLQPPAASRSIPRATTGASRRGITPLRSSQSTRSVGPNASTPPRTESFVSSSPIARPGDSLYGDSPQISSRRIHSDTDSESDSDGVTNTVVSPGPRHLRRAATAPTPSMSSEPSTSASATIRVNQMRALEQSRSRVASRASSESTIVLATERLSISSAPDNRVALSGSTRPSTSLSGPALNTRSRSAPTPFQPTVTAQVSGAPGPDYVIIAHDKNVQTWMDQHTLSWSKQYELARGVSDGRWQWADVTREKIARLANLTVSPHSEEIMQHPSSYGGKTEIWEELEREQKALEEDDCRGLGLKGGNWHGEANWYGGRVQQLVHLRESQGGFRLELGPMQKVGRSHRISRFLGSRRLLQVKLPDGVMYDPKSVKRVKELLSKKFVLCGRVFVPFAIKDGKTYFVETDEDFERASRVDECDHRRLSFARFIEWYNPLELNKTQNLSKYAARIDLGLSTSIPVLEIKPGNFFWVDDKRAAHSGGKVPTEKIFTDGCGFMNAAALLAIGRAMGFSSAPTAVQGRILGSKGVWLLHPTDRDPMAEPAIWIRPSQIKIHLVADDNFTEASVSRLHRAHRSFDLLMPSKTTAPSRLSRLTIMNLEHNHVPAEVFKTLLREGLRNEFLALTQWEGLSAMPLLWNAVNKAGGVSVQRLQRSAAGLQRALGLSRKRDEQYSDEEWELFELPTSSQSSDGSVPSGQADTSPQNIGEVILDMIQAGFSPKEDQYLYKELRQLMTNVIDAYVKEYHIVMPQSLEAFIVPDPLGVLNEGEIHFRSSQDIVEGCLYLDPKTIVGDVLIYRNPARVASDVQKVRAVLHPELAHYVDVIILPVKGKRSLASLLAGGDVDGDTAVIIFDPVIVEPFHGPPDVTPEPAGFQDNFESQESIPKVFQVVDEMNAHPDRASDILQRHLLVGLSDFDKKGTYSRFHEYAIFMYGYNDPRAILMAYMFSTVLDSRKSGLVVKYPVFQLHKEKFDRAMPPCLGGNSKVQRPHFILEVLRQEGQAERDNMLSDFANLETPRAKANHDEDLLRPWKDISSIRVGEIVDAVAALQEYVDQYKGHWGRMWSKHIGSSSPYDTPKEKKEKKRLGEKNKQKLAMCFATEIPEACRLLSDLGIFDRLRASYAYEVNPKFARAVAWQALCKIKADAKGSKAFTGEFGGAMTISAAEVRTRSLFNSASTSIVNSISANV